MSSRSTPTARSARPWSPSPPRRSTRTAISISCSPRFRRDPAAPRSPRRTTWHEQAWSGAKAAAPADHVVYDMSYLEATGAIQGYDLAVGVSSSVLDAQAAALAKAVNGPMGASLITQYMGTTGMRPDIGPT